MSDFVGYIYHALSTRPYRGPKLHGIFVDEVQVK